MTVAQVRAGAELAEVLGKLKHPPTKLNIEKQKIERAVRQVSENFHKINTENGGRELFDLIKSGKVTLHTFPDIDSDAVVANFLEFALDSIESGDAFPLFDSSTSSLLNSLQKERQVALSEPQNIRLNQLHIADNLFNRLPNFGSVSIAEVLDLRSALDRDLTNFRSKMISFAEQVSSAPWDRDFPNEVEILVVKEVAPAIAAIEEGLSVSGAIKGFTRMPLDASKALSYGGGFGAALTKFAELDIVLGASVGASLGAGAALIQDLLRRRQSAKQNQLYFYYRVGKQIE